MLKHPSGRTIRYCEPWTNFQTPYREQVLELVQDPSAYVDTEADLVYLASLITINAEKGKIRQVFCPLRLKCSETEGERQGISHRHALAEGRDISHHHYFGCLTSGFLSCDAHVSTSCLLSRNWPLPLPSFQDVLDGLTESLDETHRRIFIRESREQSEGLPRVPVSYSGCSFYPR